MGAPTAAPAQWSDPCALLREVKGANAPNQNYLQRHKCFTSPGMGGRVTLTEGSCHPCSPCLCSSHRKQRQRYSHSLQGRRGHLCQRLEAPRWKVPLAWQRSKAISRHACVAQDRFHFLGTVGAENSIQLLPCLYHQTPRKINSQSNYEAVEKAPYGLA